MFHELQILTTIFLWATPCSAGCTSGTLGFCATNGADPESEHYHNCTELYNVAGCPAFAYCTGAECNANVDLWCTEGTCHSPSPAATGSPTAPVPSTGNPTTSSPTYSPTASPSGAPSAVPTGSPTVPPSGAPTVTGSPTSGPSTAVRTGSPTIEPTNAPSQRPTLPSEAPTQVSGWPTTAGTASPTWSPTSGLPTSPDPTSGPTAGPTATGHPSAGPSANGTATATPSTNPTQRPSSGRPTWRPTQWWGVQNGGGLTDPDNSTLSSGHSIEDGLGLVCLLWMSL